jgi:outer membrane cobalamin receptor
VNKTLVLIFFISALGTYAFAQKAQDKVALSSVLSTLENQFSISFSYADQHVRRVMVTPPAKNLTLSEVLEYLHEQTGLEFQVLSERQITISPPAHKETNICGVIADGNIPLSGAAIRANSKGVAADENGYFSITGLASGDVLSISFIGYYDLDIAASEFGNTGCDTVRLRPQVMKLQEVLVRNFITKGIDVNTDGAYDIYARALGILPGLTDPDVLQTVQAVPGITSLSETVSDLNIRGGTNDQNLILWDGIKMYQSGHFFGLITTFNPYLTDRVTLIKNGTTTAFGDGVSGIIDIRTDDNVTDEFSGGGGINMINADLFLKIPLAKNLAVHVAGRRSISDLLQTPTYDQYFNRVFKNTEVDNGTDITADTITESNQTFNFYDVTAKVLYDITNRDKLRMSFMLLENTIEYLENANTSAGIESKTSSLNQGTTAGSLSYQRLWSDKFITNIQGYASNYLLSGINQNLLKNQRLLQENEVLESGLKADARIVLSKTLDLYSGYQFNETGITNLEDINNPIYRRLIKKVLRTHSLFSEVNLAAPTGNTHLRAGLRLNYFEKFNMIRLEPRLAFNQKFLTHFSFEILGEMKSQATAQIIDLQKDFLGVEKRRWYLADNEDLPIVRSSQLSAGIRFQKEKVLVSAEAYRKRVEDISSLSQGFQNQFQYARTTGNFDVTGLDALLNIHLTTFNTWLAYSWAVSTYDFPEFTPSEFPNNLDIRHTLSLGASYQTNHLQFSAGINWRTGKPYTLPLGSDAGDIIYDIPNEVRLPDYLRLDFSAKYLFNISTKVRGEIGASIWNILNKDNIINQYYRLDANGALETVQQFALGFTPNVMMRVNF